MDRAPGRVLADHEPDLTDGPRLLQIDLDPLGREVPRIPDRPWIAINSELASVLVRPTRDTCGLAVGQVGAGPFGAESQAGTVVEVAADEAGEGEGLRLRQGPIG